MVQDKARVIFIGNIPYGLTEEQIVHTFSSAGQVLNFRLVYDKDTGKPKGFGFAEFADADSAASAVRNLNDYEIMGRRLRVDYSNDGGSNDSAPAGYSAHQQQPSNGQDQPQGGLPPLPPGVDLPPNLTCPDAISRTLSTLPPPQLLDILSQMKGLVMSDPQKATELLRTAPQLSYAIFQSLLLLGLVDTTLLKSVVSQPPAPQQPPPPQQAMPPQYPPHLQQQHVPTPPMYNQPYQAPQPAPQQEDPQRAALLQRLIAMTPQELAAYPPEVRTQLEMARQQALAGQRF